MTQRCLRIEEIREETRFEGLHDAWNHLAARASRSIFLRHEWFSAAWAWRRANAALRIVCVHRGDSLVGVFPLVKPHRRSHQGRRLEFLSVPDTQCCDVIAASEDAQDVCEALADHLVQSSADWDELRLCRLPQHSVTESYLRPLLVLQAAHCEFQADDCNLFVDLQGAWKDYYATRSRSLKKACNLAANRLARTGTLEVERVSANHAQLQCPQRLLNEVVATSGRSWKRVTGNTLDSAGPRAFIQRLTDHACENDWLSLWLLRINGKAVAMEYQLVLDDKVHALRADFDDNYRSLSPGSYLSRHLMEQLFANRFKRYYMGPGRDPYKTRWSNAGDTLHSMTAYAPTLRGRTIALWPRTLKPQLRTLRDRLISF